MDITQLHSIIRTLDGYLMIDIYNYLEDYFIDNTYIEFPHPIKTWGTIGNIYITGLEQVGNTIYAIINDKHIELASLRFDKLILIYDAVYKMNNSHEN